MTHIMLSVTVSSNLTIFICLLFVIRNVLLWPFNDSEWRRILIFGKRWGTLATTDINPQIIQYCLSAATNLRILENWAKKNGKEKICCFFLQYFPSFKLEQCDFINDFQEFINSLVKPQLKVNQVLFFFFLFVNNCEIFLLFYVRFIICKGEARNWHSPYWRHRRHSFFVIRS